eukprot:CCRYP_019200-RA/>CCRYP_019200-RA protein AED:0.34 eAED:0.34 QI:343/0/0/1/0/0/2/0/68
MDEPNVGESDFVECDWSDFTRREEALPPNAPKPLGKGVTLRMFRDSDHAGDKVSRRQEPALSSFSTMG